MRSTERKNKKILAVIIFALIIAFLVSAGTIAWLTRTSTITNTFTVGSFETPTTSPTEPETTISIDGNIYEPSWDEGEEHKLLPSTEFDKDPYVGIGKGSEDAVVYVFVKNNFTNKVYFSINEGWEAVEAKAGSVADTYTSGLFKYTAGLSGATEADVWTSKPLFDKVSTADDSTVEDFTPVSGENEIVVSSFLHQVNDSEGTPIDADTIETAAKAVFEIQ